MRTPKSLITALFGAVVLLGTAGAASASPWTLHHPRRVEVNHRLNREDHRINHDVRDGKVTLQQARSLHREDRAIRGQERLDARFGHSHITRAQDRALNQDENGVNRQIRHDAL